MNKDVNISIFNKYKNTIKYKQECDAIIELLVIYYVFPNDLDWLALVLKDYKKWRLKKAIIELKSNNYIVAIGLECSNLNNQKDSWKLTNKGNRLAKILFNFEFDLYSPSVRKSPACCRRRNIVKIMFEGELDTNAKLLSGDFIYKNIEFEETTPYRGLYAAGFLLTTEDNYLVYSLSQSNISVYEKKEVLSLKKVESLIGKYSKRNMYEIGFNRIIIVDNPSVIKTMFNTRKNSKWFLKDGKTYRRQYDYALFYPDESLLRGKAFVLNRSLSQKETIKWFYLNPDSTMKSIDEIIKKMIIENENNTGRVELIQKHPLATIETEKFVVFNLIVQDLHRMSSINKLLVEGNEKREVVVYTTKKQEAFVKECFKDYEDQLLLVPVEEEIIVKELEYLKQ